MSKMTVEGLVRRLACCGSDVPVFIEMSNDIGNPELEAIKSVRVDPEGGVVLVPENPLQTLSSD